MAKRTERLSTLGSAFTYWAVSGNGLSHAPDVRGENAHTGRLKQNVANDKQMLALQVLLTVEVDLIIRLHS